MATDSLDAVGARLRELRRNSDVTLAVLAERTGISVSTLSRLESGQRRPTLELLLPLARAYRVTLDELVDAPETGDPRIHAKPIDRGWGTVIPLTRRPGGLQAFKMVLRPGADRRRPREQQTHEGYEWMYILDGKLRLILGDQDIVLGPGEVVEFDTHTPHWFGCAERRTVELLTLFGPQGERMHVKSRPAPAK